LGQRLKVLPLGRHDGLNIKARQAKIAQCLGHIEKPIRARFSLFSLCHHNLPGRKGAICASHNEIYGPVRAVVK
jgi:hypothetical protein